MKTKICKHCGKEIKKEFPTHNDKYFVWVHAKSGRQYCIDWEDNYAEPKTKKDYNRQQTKLP